MNVVWDGTAPGVYERTMGPGQPDHVAHLANPDWPGWSLCLIRLKGPRRGGRDCEACTALALRNRNAWIAR